MASKSEKHMSETHNDKEFLEFIVSSIVTNPSAVKVTRVVDEMGVLLTLDVDPVDMSRVIGRMGNTAKAIRTLLRVVGMKHNARVNLKINEPEGGRVQAPSAQIDSTDELINDLKGE
jgi:predicted RNA-binding protein YlqC (UPF0109 family)